MIASLSVTKSIKELTIVLFRTCGHGSKDDSWTGRYLQDECVMVAQQKAVQHDLVDHSFARSFIHSFIHSLRGFAAFHGNKQHSNGGTSF